MSQLARQDDEINLGELVAAIWHNFWIIGLVTALCFSWAAYYSYVIATPQFEASSRFELLDGEGAGPSLGGQASGLAAFAGISLPGSPSEADTLEDRILTRSFVASIYEVAGFEQDSVFNARLREPSLKTRVREFIFGPSESMQPSRNDFLVMAIGALSDRMVIDAGDNGIIKLTISHPDPARAAKIVNIIVEQSLQNIFNRERNETRESLNYFAEELLQVRSDLDAANAAVRDYALTNNLQSAEELARTSAQLAQVRRDIDTIDKSILALEKMNSVQFNGSDFAQLYPVSTSLSFRRLLGLSGDPSTWVKPLAAELDEARERLQSQKAPLLSSFSALEARAKSSGAEALKLAALKREVEVQQAIYESVITQFEAQSLFSGFERASGRVVESAIAPTGASSPRKTIIVALGLVLGLFCGCVLAILSSMLRGKLYTRSAIVRAFGSIRVGSPSVFKLGGLGTTPLNHKQKLASQDLLVSIGERQKIVSILPLRSEILGARLALSLSKTSAELGKKSAIFDFTKNAFDRVSRDAAKGSESAYSVFSFADGIDLVVPLNQDIYLRASERQQTVEALKETYDQVLLVLPAPVHGTALSRVMAEISEASLIVTQRTRTNRRLINSIKSILTRFEGSEPLLVVV